MNPNELKFKILQDVYVMPGGQARLIVSAEDYEKFAHFDWQFVPGERMQEGKIVFTVRKDPSGKSSFESKP